MMRGQELLDALATGRMTQRAIESLVTPAGRAFAGPPKKSGPFGVVSSTGTFSPDRPLVLVSLLRGCVVCQT